MDNELVPVRKLLIDLFKGLGVVVVELCCLPPFVGSGESFCGLYEEIELTFLLEDSGIVRVGEGTGGFTAESCEVVLVAAEGSGFGSDKITLI